jgi:hypothetical protein
VDFAYSQNGVIHEYTSVFDSYLTETRTIDNLHLYDSEPLYVKVHVTDKFGNASSVKDTTLVLPTDEALPKNAWTLPGAGSVVGGAVQSGGNMIEAIDGLTEADVSQNYYLTNSNNPWNIIIDLGEKYELSRIVTNQRYSGGPLYSVQGNYYRGDNVLAYNLYIWDEAYLSWEFVGRHDIRYPLVNQESEFVALGNAGDMAFLYPEEPRFSKPTRFFRFEAINGKFISEITLYGRK